VLAARVEQASAANFLHDPPDAMRYGEAALAAARRAGMPRWMYRAGYALAQAHMTAGAYRSAVPLLDQALAHLAAPPTAASRSDEDAAPVLRYAVLCSMMKAVAHAAMGDRAPAEAAQRRADDHADAADRPYERIAASYGRGFVSLQWGRLNEAEAALRTGLDLAERYSVRQFSPVVSCQWGKLLLARGDAAAAVDALLAARDLARQVGHALSQVRAGAWLGLALVQRGEHGAALREGVAAVEVAGQHHLDGARAEALLAEATIRLRGPDPDEARLRAALLEAIRIGEATGARPLVAAGATRLAALLRRQGRDADAETLGRQAGLLLTGMGMAPI
jgi:tetratricopeptide (TPR) repeat protein